LSTAGVDEEAETAWRRHQPARWWESTVPFPRRALRRARIARRMKALEVRAWPRFWARIRQHRAGARFPTPRLFDDFDYVTYDDGEVPLLRIVEKGRLVRTRVRRRGRVVWVDDADGARVCATQIRPAPDFRPLLTHGYLAMGESPNPMPSAVVRETLAQAALAHGCYWQPRCTFCDTPVLDHHSGRSIPLTAATIVGWMESTMSQTGESGFHFVDEAAPPALLAAVARRILAPRPRGEVVGPISASSDTSTPALVGLLARSGCLGGHRRTGNARPIACWLATQGLRPSWGHARDGRLCPRRVLVHAYLMYGYPTQTAPGNRGRAGVGPPALLGRFP